MVNSPLEVELDLSSLEGADFDARLLHAVVDHWHQCLMNRADRDATLRRLGVSLDQAVQLRLGFSDRSLGTRIPNAQWKAGSVIRNRLRAFGVMRSSGHEAFRGFVIIPIHDSEGLVVALNGQRPTSPRGEMWAAGLPGGVFEMHVRVRGSAPHDDVNGVIEQPAETVIITSSILDALAIVGAAGGREVEGVSAPELVVLAPGRSKGFSTKDLKELATRFASVQVLGRDATALAAKLQRRGLRVFVDVEQSDLARLLTTSSNPQRALGAVLRGVTQLDELSTETVGSAEAPTHQVDGVGLAVTSEPPALLVGEVGNPETPSVVSTPGRDEVIVRYARRSWRIRGACARSNVEGDRLSVALSVNDVEKGRFHLDTLDLYAARQRSTFLEAAVEELRATREVLQGEMMDVISTAERCRDDESLVETVPHEMSDLDRERAISWLSDPILFANVARDLATLGVVGEATNLTLCYLATISRKCERPLGVLVQSSSASGKSTLVDAVCSLVPPEDLVALSAITAQALFYLGRSGLSHKVLSVAEETGSQRASYALKLLLSEGRLSIATPGTSASSGRLVTKNYETAGPVALVMTTTSTEIDPELENRLVVLGVNEDAEQTAAIIGAQRRGASLDGLVARRSRDELRHLHANVQRLLTPMPVVIGEFEASFPSTSTRHRRDHAKLLSIITAITLLHQFQREHLTVHVGDETITYLVASEVDIRRGVALAREVLVRGSEHLAPQTARLLHAVRDYTKAQGVLRSCASTDVDVTRRELREWLGWSDTQVRTATDRLVALEHLVVSGGGRGRCRTYRLVPDLGPLDATTAGTTDVPSAHEGAVRGLRSSQVRSSQLRSSGSSDQFVEFVPSGNSSEGDVATTPSYTEMVSDQ